MARVERIVNKIFKSNTYVISNDGSKDVWLVDVGDTKKVLSILPPHSNVKGVFLTHAHFDHIYGLNALVEAFPYCKVYVTEYTQQALASDKLNLSRYYETPFTYQGDNIVVVKEGDSLSLFDDEPTMSFYETPGHNPGCLTMVMGDMIFTGDAYIPGVGANTKVPHADKELAKLSLERIIRLTEGKRVYCGHLVKCLT